MKTEMELDEETLAFIFAYCGRDPRQRKEVTREAFCEYGSEEWSLAEFQEIIAAAIESIPPERREAARVELEGGYDESTCLKISYADWQSDEEVAKDVASALRYANEKLARERIEFERLKRKFAE